MVRREAEYPSWDLWWAAGRPHAMSFMEFERAMERWVEDGVHSGPQDSTDLAHYTRLNAHRMRRARKTMPWTEELRNALAALDADRHHWVLITESWCGDGAMTGALVAAMAEESGIPLEVVLRDGPSGLMDDFLTRGGRSIPIWILADSGGSVLGYWGPRPEPLQAIVDAHRAAPEPKPDYRSFSEQVQLWYARDRGRAFLEEAMALFEACL